MTERLERVERLLTGGALVLLGLFLLYNVGLRVILTVGVTTPLADLVGWPFDTTLLDTNPVRWTVLALGTLPLVWVGGRTLRGRGTRRASWWASVWAVGVVSNTVGPFRTVLEWGYFESEYSRFDYLWTVPTQVEAALVSGGLVVVLVVGGLVSLWHSLGDQSAPATRAATRTEDGHAGTGKDEQVSTRRRRLLVAGGSAAGLAVTLLFQLDRFPFSPLRYGRDRTTEVPTTFDYEVRSDGRVRVTHAGGDALTDENTGAVTVRYTAASEDQRREIWAGGSGGEFSISAGDTFTTASPVEPGSTLRVVSLEAAGETETVGSFEVDE